MGHALVRSHIFAWLGRGEETSNISVAPGAAIMASVIEVLSAPDPGYSPDQGDLVGRNRHLLPTPDGVLL